MEPRGTPRNPLLLEISAWPWLTRLSKEQGRVVTLADVPGAYWDRVAAAGFDLVYLMGVWRRSAIGRLMARTDPGLFGEYDRGLPGWAMADVVGSPYSIQAYEPDDRMGGWKGLEIARRELNARGIGLVLDFVPNHTGFDHDWIATSPDHYVLGTVDGYRRAPGDFRPFDLPDAVRFVACGRDPYFPPWRDVAQLNYFNPETRAAVRQTIADVSAHCDGLRCDMAMLALNDVFERTWSRLLGDRWPRPAEEFWPETIAANRGLIFLAEVYWDLEGVLLAHGFDFTYDKRLLDGLQAPEHERAGRVRMLVTAGPDQTRMARFLENHDEPRSVPSLEPVLPAAASLLTTLPGLRFFYDGQSEGRRVRTPVQMARWPDEPTDERVRKLYDRLLQTASTAVFHEGICASLDVSAAGDGSFTHLVAYRWIDGSRLAVVVVNLGPGAAQGHVRVIQDMPGGDAFEFFDQLTGAGYRWTCDALRDRGLYVRLEHGMAHVFVVSSVA